MQKLLFGAWVVAVTRHELHELPRRLHGYLHTAYAQGVEVVDAREAHVEQRNRETRQPKRKEWQGSY